MPPAKNMTTLELSNLLATWTELMTPPDDLAEQLVVRANLHPPPALGHRHSALKNVRFRETNSRYFSDLQTSREPQRRQTIRNRGDLRKR